MDNKEKILVNDFANAKRPGDVQFCQNNLLFTLTTINLKNNSYTSNIWIMDLIKNSPKNFTIGDKMDISPRYSPIGDEIAFLSTSTGKQQIHIMPFSGGESKCVTNLNGRFGSIKWSPNGEYLAFTFQRNDEEKRPKMIKKFFYIEDGGGLAPDDYWHLWLLDVKTSKVKQLTFGEYDHSEPDWAPDSKSIAIISNRNEDANYDTENADIWTIDINGNNFKKISNEYGPALLPKWSPDGKYIAYVGNNAETGTEQIKNYHIWILDVATGISEDISADLDRSCKNLLISDASQGYDKNDELKWAPDSSGVYALVSDKGRAQIYFMGLNKKYHQITKGDMEIYSYALGKDSIFFTMTNPLCPGEVCKIDLDKDFPQEPQVLTKFNKKFIEKLDIVAPEFFECEGVNRKVYGFLYKPPGFDSQKKYPLVMMIHGGPYLLYGANFFHEMHCLAASGFVVFCPNQGGSQGYGEHHASLISKNWGEGDFPDLMKAVDYIISQGYIDENKMGVGGGSYGGFMTNWVITHTNRFKAAITQRCISEFLSFFGTSDSGTYFTHELGGPPWKNWKNYMKFSPFYMVEKINTPLLIIHSQGDYRTPVSQGEQLYKAMRYEKKEVEMLYFPGESHNLSRSGKPINRLERLNAIKNWFEKYFK